MNKLDKFSKRGIRNSRYPFPEMAKQPGVVWELEAGKDFDGSFEATRRAAHQWATRHDLKAVTSVVKDANTIEIMFTTAE